MDVFFVISGYLIGRILLAEVVGGGISFAGFFERRARRILPALFVMLLLVTPPAYLLLPPDDVQSFANSLLGATWFSSNFVFMGEAGYFDRGAEAKPLLHTWSLAVEEQFYLIFPVLLALLAKLNRVFVGLLLGVGLSFACALSGLRAEADWPFFMLVSRAWELGLGALVAVASTHRKAGQWGANRHLGQLLPGVGLAAIIIAALTFSQQTPTPGLPMLLPTLGTVLILLQHSSKGWVTLLLSQPLFTGLGLVSYAFYLWHQPLLVLGRFYASGPLTLVSSWALIVCALILAVLSWKFVEQPFRDRERWSRKGLAIFLSVSVAVITALGVVLKYTDSPTQRAASVPYGDAGHSEYYRYMDTHFDRCEDEQLLYRIEQWQQVPRCHSSRVDGPVRVAFLGDSHAEQLFVGAAPRLNAGAIYLIRGGMPFVREDRFRSPLYYLQEQKSLEVVVFSAYWTEKIAMLGREAFINRLFETVKWLVSRDLNVVLMLDTPDFGYGPERCIYSERVDTAACSMTVEQHQQTQGAYRAVFESMAKHPRVELIDVSDVVCDGLNCGMINGDSLLYRDNDHLNLIGSGLAGVSLLSKSKFLRPYSD